MGGRSTKYVLPDRESWITEVSDSRLASYERMLSSPSAREVRSDGSARKFHGEYFRDLVQTERNRRLRGET